MISVEDRNTRVQDASDLFPTENFNVVVSSDPHYFDITDRMAKAAAVQSDAELIRDTAETFNASTHWALGDFGNLRSVANLIDNSRVDEAVVVKGDEDRKGGSVNRDSGWVYEGEPLEQYLESNTLVRKGKEFTVDLGEYEVLLDHYPGRPGDERRTFEYDWFADDLYYRASENLYPEAFSEPVVAITGHNHAPFVRQLDSAVALNAGALGLNYNGDDAVPDSNIYAVSFDTDEVHVAMIDAEDRRIKEYDRFKLRDERFSHENVFSEVGKYHPEERFRNDSLPDQYIDEMTRAVERITPEILND